MRSKIMTLSCAVLLAASVATAATETEAPSLEQRIDDYLRPYSDIGHPSGSLLIARGDAVLYEKSFGSGSVYSTTRDLLKLQQAVLAGTLGKLAREALIAESGNVIWNGLALCVKA